MKFQIDKNQLIKKLLLQEDTTYSQTITIDDNGPKRLDFQDKSGNTYTVKGTYYLSNLLQEAALLKNGNDQIDFDNIYETPTDRLSRVIKNYYWKMLTRSIDENGLASLWIDQKRESKLLRLYVPEKDKYAQQFYAKIVSKFKNVKIENVPKNITQQYIHKHLDKPGILGLAIDKKNNKSLPFVVPGGRFNEMYGWDSYFIAKGLIIDDEFDLAKAMIENLEYQIVYYGKILNANRSYYLTRSQPPFFTSFLIEIYQKYANNLSMDWLRKKLETAIIEYENVWKTKNIRFTPNGLNRYFDEGKGIPMETEKGHFKHELNKFAKKHNIEPGLFETKYKNGEILDEELDQFFIHDRSMRESGHDTTNRLNNVSANINPICLNALLYKYETDICYIIKTYFDDNIELNGKIYSSYFWDQLAIDRKSKINKLLWNNEKSTFFDYNFVINKQCEYVSATNFYPLWAKLCTQEQAQQIVDSQLPFLKQKGGIVSVAKAKTQNIEEPGRQWDFPYGWAPHQILVWEGLLNYGFNDIAQELIYRWLWLFVKTAVNYNGLIPEKFDVVNCTHEVNVEYGNVGTDFKYVPDGGFGWTNASYKLGMQLLDKKHIKNLNELTDPDTFLNEIQV